MKISAPDSTDVMSNPNASDEAAAIAASDTIAADASNITSLNQQITSYNMQITQLNQQLVQTQTNLDTAVSALSDANAQYISDLTDILNGFSSTAIAARAAAKESGSVTATGATASPTAMAHGATALRAVKTPNVAKK